jgi:aspartyl-tRNA(Asn)/glutamyl-tRNA(Gln) amidotransferase subunit A
MTASTIKALSAQLAAKEVSAVELARHYLARIDAGAHLNAFIHVDAEATLAQAQAADARIAAGNAAPLTGVPIAHKDVFVTRGWRATAGSKMLGDYVSPFDATVVERLSAAGMVTLGKTNMDEFAMGSSNENSAFGPVKNPWNVEHVPGGSSGGSAAAVAADLAPAATGTDTGGSIRQPASFSGITGIKPTYGRVSRYGMIAFASSLDQGGPMARTAEDCALLLSAMAGFDPRDSTSLEPGRGGDVEDFTRLLSIPTYYVIAPAEASSNLSRFDGVRYGHRAAEYRDLADMYRKSRAEGFGWEVKRRILVGAYVLSHGYYDAYYLQAQKIRRIIAQDFQNAFGQCDVIMGPVAPTVAWKLGEKSDDPVQMYLEDIFTLSTSLAGLPGMSVPAGFGANGLPVGLQIIGNYFEEARMLQIAHAFQQATDWHARQPAA